jgi:hypothetical protein
MQYHKLVDLLSQTWASPVFADSYPHLTPENSEPVWRQVKTIHTEFVAVLRPLLIASMPDAAETEMVEIVRQIGAKSTAFCGAIAAGEVDDLARLRAAAVSIALVYWCDQSMDRGDTAMATAVHSLHNYPNSGDALPPLAAARLRGVRAIDAELTRLSRPEDVPWLRRAVFQDTLLQEARIWELSQQYLIKPDKDAFWDYYADEVAWLSINNGALIYVTAAIYAIYRCHRPELPSLEEIFSHEPVMRLLQGPANAAIRVFDDFGDRHIDSGAYPQWGGFCLNLFNQSDGRFLAHFLRHAHLDDPRLSRAFIAALQSNDADRYEYATAVFADFLRERVATVPAPVWERYAVFLTLAKRVLEAGYVNAMGDMELAER